jgi:acetate kinase
LKDLSGFGVELDEEKNKFMKGGGVISAENSRVKILVVPVNEEMIVARGTVAVVSRVNATAQPMAGQSR